MIPIPSVRSTSAPTKSSTVSNEATADVRQSLAALNALVADRKTVEASESFYGIDAGSIVRAHHDGNLAKVLNSRDFVDPANRDRFAFAVKTQLQEKINDLNQQLELTKRQHDSALTQWVLSVQAIACSTVLMAGIGANGVLGVVGIAGIVGAVPATRALLEARDQKERINQDLKSLTEVSHSL